MNTELVLQESMLEEAKEVFIKDYASNLYHIKKFYKFSKTGKIDSYQQAFNDFLFNFRISRNVKKGKAKKLLATTLQWIKNPTKANDVDGFAEELREQGIT